VRRFQFTEPQWKRILDSIKCNDGDIWIRERLEWIAQNFRSGLKTNIERAKSENKDFLGLTKQAKLLLPIFDRLSNTMSLRLLFAASPNLDGGPRQEQKDIERRISEFRIELENPISSSWIFGAPPRRVPANVDLDRNSSWEALVCLYEDQTGHRAAASESPNLGARRSPPNGPFVRFVQAFTAAVPGEKEPTGDEIRGWLRSFRRQYPDAFGWRAKAKARAVC
jgi:hypothetical protein